MQEIWIDDYIGNNSQALNAITNFNEGNKYVVKASTGIGGTTAIIQHVQHSVVILAPLTGIIVNKSISLSNNDVFYLYKGSNHTIHDLHKVVIGEVTHKVMCTPEMLSSYLKSYPEYKEQLLQLPLFVDESHIPIEADYRTTMGNIMDMVYNEWKGNYILSTATPQHNFIELPQRVKSTINYIKISRVNKQSQPLVLLNKQLDKHHYLINESLIAGKKVIVFSNDKKEIKKLVQLTENYQCLLGDKLLHKLSDEIRMSKNIEENCKRGIIDNDCQLFILSTKYLTGFDIHIKDADVFIYANENSKTDNKSVYDIKQALGRLRSGCSNAYLVYQSKGFDNNVHSMIREIKQSDSYTMDNQGIVNRIGQALTYDVQRLAIKLNEFGVNLITQSLDEQNENVEFERLTNGRALRKLLDFYNGNYKVVDEYSDNELLYMRFYNNIIKELSLSNEGGYSFNLLKLYAVVYMVQNFSDNVYIKGLRDKIYDNDEVKLNRVIKDLYKFIYLNYTHLNQYYNTLFIPTDSEINDCKYKGGKMDNFIQRCQVLSKFEDVDLLTNTEYSYKDLPANTIHIINYAYVLNEVGKDRNRSVQDSKYLVSIEGLSDLQNCFRDMHRTLTNTLGNKLDDTFYANLYNQRKTFGKTFFRNIYNKYKTNKDVIEHIDANVSMLKAVKSVQAAKMWFNYLSFNNRELIGKYNAHALFMLGALIGSYGVGFKVADKDYREYNPSTKCPSMIRYDFLPYQYIEADIKSAFAQVIDKVIGSNRWEGVYSTVMSKKGISRGKAKVLYNVNLNWAEQSVSDKNSFFSDCGYSPDEVSKIIYYSTQTDDSKFFYLATEYEKNAIDEFRELNSIKWGVRIHDALMYPKFNNNKEIKQGAYVFGVTEYGNNNFSKV